MKILSLLLKRNPVKTFGLCSLLILAAGGCKETPREEANPTIRISGTIQINPELLAHARESDTIYLIARPATGGPPVAVQRLRGKKYPYSFVLSENDKMMPHATVRQPLNLSVRVDKDGDAMTKTSGDLIGSYQKNPASIQSDRIVIQIDRRIP